MKIIKNHIFTTLAIILFATALLVTACVNAEHEGTPKTKEEVEEREKAKKLPEGKGAILLKFGDNSRVTIAPDVPYDDLNFTVAVSLEDKRIIFEKNVKMSKDEAETIPIILDEGEYKVVVFGYYKTSDIAAYAGEVETSVASGGTKGVPIKMKGIVDEGGQGKFSYSITLPATPIDAAEMKIEPVSWGAPEPPINLKTKGYSSATDIDLEAGYYRITITYSGSSAFDTNIITWILHIYPDMPTHFDCKLPPLLRSSYTVIYYANGGEFIDGTSVKEVPYSPGSKIDQFEYRPTWTGTGKKTFSTWFKDLGLVHPWDYNTERIWEDIELYARYDVTEDEELEEDVDFDINADGKGGKIFILGESLDKIMTAHPDSYLLIEIMFVQKLLPGDPGNYWFFNPDEGFGQIYDSKYILQSIHLKMGDVNGLLTPGDTYLEGQTAMLKIDVRQIQTKYEDVYAERLPSHPNYDPYHVMEDITILIQQTGHAILTGRLFFHNGP
jgi:hypothetical protein